MEVPQVKKRESYMRFIILSANSRIPKTAASRNRAVMVIQSFLHSKKLIYLLSSLVTRRMNRCSIRVAIYIVQLASGRIRIFKLSSELDQIYL